MTDKPDDIKTVAAKVLDLERTKLGDKSKAKNAVPVDKLHEDALKLAGYVLAQPAAPAEEATPASPPVDRESRPASYRPDGDRVVVVPAVKQNDDGTTSTGLSFTILHIHNEVANPFDVAATFAKILNDSPEAVALINP